MCFVAFLLFSSSHLLCVFLCFLSFCFRVCVFVTFFWFFFFFFSPWCFLVFIGTLCSGQFWLLLFFRCLSVHRHLRGASKRLVARRLPPRQLRAERSSWRQRRPCAKGLRPRVGMHVLRTCSAGNSVPVGVYQCVMCLCLCILIPKKYNCKLLVCGCVKALREINFYIPISSFESGNRHGFIGSRYRRATVERACVAESCC